MAEDTAIVLRSPFTGGTIAVPPDYADLPRLLAAGFTVVTPAPVLAVKKSKRAS